MDAALTFADLTRLIVILGSIFGAYKLIMEIVKVITDRHDKEKAWDNVAKDVSEERQKIVERYDDRLSELENKIDQNHAETEAKIQELSAIVIMLTKSVKAILDGQVEQGLNGHVRKQRDELDEYLSELIGK